MKIRLLIIIGIVIASVGIATVSIFGIQFILHATTSYDFTLSTKENPYGVAARVLVPPT